MIKIDRGYQIDFRITVVNRSGSPKIKTEPFAQDAAKIAGIWWNDSKTSKIEVKEENGKFIGTVIYINPEKYINGEPEKDHQNPDAKLRSRSRLGLQILSGLKFNASDKEWQGGRIYDPDNGKTCD